MIIVSVCIGSSCHLKGSEELVRLFQEKIAKENMEDRVILSGSFCLGVCNRVGVTVSVSDGENDQVFTGVTPEGFYTFWNETVIPKLKESET